MTWVLFCIRTNLTALTQGDLYAVFLTAVPFAIGAFCASRHPVEKGKLLLWILIWILAEGAYDLIVWKDLVRWIGLLEFFEFVSMILFWGIAGGLLCRMAVAILRKGLREKTPEA